MKNEQKYTASSVNHQSNTGVDLEKIFRKRARYSNDYTCTHCLKTFASAQSFGGHQKAHRAEKEEEKRLHVKNHYSYRKQRFLQSLHSHGVPSVPVLPPTQPQLQVQGPSKATSTGYGQNMHGNQTKPKSLSSLDLNLPATGSDDEIDVEQFSSEDKNTSNAVNTNTSNENNDGNGIVSCQPLDLCLKL